MALGAELGTTFFGHQPPPAPEPQTILPLETPNLFQTQSQSSDQVQTQG
jgi:hypothetical protein